jgi:hypothetical protein
MQPQEANEKTRILVKECGFSFPATAVLLNRIYVT